MVDDSGREKTMINTFCKEVEKGNAPKLMAESFEQQFEYSGVEHALLSSMRYFPMDNLQNMSNLATQICLNCLSGVQKTVTCLLLA
jgi:hypothetical protein